MLIISSETKECVACAEDIKSGALLCRFCGTIQADFVSDTSKTKLKSSNVGWRKLFHELARRAWVLAAGFVPIGILKPPFDGIYGPTQPIGVFGIGVLFASIALATLTWLIDHYLSYSHAGSHAMHGRSVSPVGYWLWALISFSIVLLFFAVGMDYYRNR